MRSWNTEVNPYSELIRTKPGRILLIENGRASPEEAAQLASARARYPRLYVELGSGSGGHLIELAARNPDTLCLGFELRYKRAFRTALKSERRDLENLLVLRADALLLPALAEQGSIDGIFVNFPDPWDKKRWKKKRLLNPGFIAEIVRLLKPDGFLSYKTDHSEYFEEVLGHLGTVPEFTVGGVSRDLHAETDQNGNILTEFEQLFRSQKVPVHILRAKKLCSAP